MAPTPVPDPTGGLVSAGIGLIGDIAGTIISYNQEKLKAKKAEEYQTLEERQQKERDRFSMDITSKELGLKREQVGIEKGRFGLEKLQAAGGISKDMLQQVADLANKHTALGNNVVKMWGV
jgi:hypothetical protein